MGEYDVAAYDTAINKNASRFARAIADNKSDLDVAKLAVDAGNDTFTSHTDKETNQRILMMIESAQQDQFKHYDAQMMRHETPGGEGSAMDNRYQLE